MAKRSFGVEIHPYYDVATLMHEITLAEELGYDQVWVGDSNSSGGNCTCCWAPPPRPLPDPAGDRRHQSRHPCFRGHGQRRGDTAGVVRGPADPGHRQRLHLGEYHGQTPRYTGQAGADRRRDPGAVPWRPGGRRIR